MGFLVLGALALAACSSPGEKTGIGVPEGAKLQAPAAQAPAAPKPAAEPAVAEKPVPAPQQEAGAAAGVGGGKAAAAAAAVGGAAGPAKERAAAPAKPGESVVRFDNDKLKEQGPVEFSHPRHKEAFGQEPLDCKPCHTQAPPLFLMKKRAPGEARYTMEEMNQGEACGKCHDGKVSVNGKTAFAVSTEESCGKCHQK
jgi:c(7)-type cytochrome triheme protein